MTTILNATKTKAVNIHNNSGMFRAMYIAFYTEPDGYVDRQVLDSRTFKTMKGAERWAKKQLAN